ncbi:MAG: response regulator [Candidatus Omnitrophica bacterium]|nr:response regulator [Candidatus Omnitrophota bacterium]
MTTQSESSKILIIDDDPLILRLMDEVLKTKGYEILIASEAASGLEMAIKKNPDLIILDVMMPIINGYNICRLLKKEVGMRDVPIIFLTCRSEEDDRRIGEQVGADAYLPKPFNTPDLLLKIEELLKSRVRR